MVGVRPREDGELDLYAPLGLDDVFNLVLRPNPLWPQAVDERFWAKARRYRSVWPGVTVTNV
jgi:hypothetical protein